MTKSLRSLNASQLDSESCITEAEKWNSIRQVFERLAVLNPSQEFRVIQARSIRKSIDSWFPMGWSRGEVGYPCVRSAWHRKMSTQEAATWKDACQLIESSQWAIPKAIRNSIWTERSVMRLPFAMRDLIAINAIDGRLTGKMVENDAIFSMYNENFHCSQGEFDEQVSAWRSAVTLAKFLSDCWLQLARRQVLEIFSRDTAMRSAVVLVLHREMLRSKFIFSMGLEEFGSDFNQLCSNLNKYLKNHRSSLRFGRIPGKPDFVGLYFEKNT